jgi:hypothetical protein
MKNILIKQKGGVDLHSIKIRDAHEERVAIIELQKQIRGWISEKFGDHEKEIITLSSSSILLNKLVYYITNEIKKNNPNFIITSGWYKYGPCYENGRKAEGSFSLETFQCLERGEKIVDEVNSVCKEHVPMFWKSITGDHNSFPYSYLSYVYDKKVDFPFLKAFYTSKHELLDALIYNKEILKDEKKMARMFMNFDAAIINPNYVNQVNLNDQDVYNLTEFTSLLAYYIFNCPEKKEELEEMKNYFNDYILRLFSSKNYIKTLQCNNANYAESIKTHEEEIASRILERLPKEVSKYYSLLS